MSTTGERWRAPPLWLIAAVALLHLVWLGPTPRRESPRPARPHAPALLTRALSLPASTTAMPLAPARPAETLATPHAALPTPRSTTATRATISSARATRTPDTAPRSTVAPKPDPATTATDPPRPLALADAAQPAPPAPVRVAGPSTLSYQVSGHARGLDYAAEAELQWRRHGTRYEARWSVDQPLIGTRWQRSEGTVTEAGLAPERFSERSRGERAAHFDTEAARIRFSANTPDVTLAAGGQDRLSVILQLGALLAAAPERYPVGAQIVVQTAGVREAEAWTWDVQGDETLSVAGQELTAVKLLRQARKDYDTRIELWLARTLEYLPVRLRITQANGDVADQQLQAVVSAPMAR